MRKNDCENKLCEHDIDAHYSEVVPVEDNRGMIQLQRRYFACTIPLCPCKEFKPTKTRVG